MGTGHGDPDPAGLLARAVEAARGAGDLLGAANLRDLQVHTKSTPTDVVTSMDRDAETLIVGALRAQGPDDGFLGEEGADSTGSSGIRWVIDPLDGTVNYLYGLGGWAVSIAAVVAGETLAGVVHVPSWRQTFTAVRGAGARCNDEPIACGSGPEPAQALVSTGFGYDAARRAHQAEVLRRLLPAVRDVRRLGACSVDLCCVAAGRVDAYYERGCNLWDFAAGALIATEAGALVGGLDGAPAAPEFLLAAPPATFGPLHDLLCRAGAGSETTR